MSIVEEYLKVYKEHVKRYSDRIAVFYHIGSFYETYEWAGEGLEQVGNAFEFGELLHIRVTLRDTKSPHSLKNPYMVGFPLTALDDKYKDVILRNNYTLIRYDQSAEDKTKRVLVELTSPSTSIGVMSSSGVSNIVLTLYIECLNDATRYENIKILSGLCHADLSTGKIHVGELYTSNRDTVYVFHEIYRVINHVKPKELICHIKSYKGNNPEGYKSWICTTLGFRFCPIFVISCDEIPKAFLQSSYQEQVLNKVYKGVGVSARGISLNLNGLGIGLNKGSNLDIFQELEIDKLAYGTVALILLLQYCEEHDPIILKRISKPTMSWLDQEQRLTLEYNAAEQLKLVSDTKTRSKKKLKDVLSVIDFTSTNTGERNLRSLILNPYTEAKLIKSKYEPQQKFLKISFMFIRIPDSNKHKTRSLRQPSVFF